MNERRRRAVAGLVLPILGVGLAGVVIAAVGDSTPDPLATHWALDGEPNDSTSRSAFLAVFGVIVVLLAGVIAVVGRREARRGELAPIMAVAAFFQWVVVGVLVMTLLANRDVSSWEDARELPFWLALTVPLVAAAVAATTGALMASVGRPVDAPTAAPTVGAAPGERLAWFAQVEARWPLVLGVPLAVAGVAVLVTGNRFVGGVLIAVALIVSVFTRVSVTADGAGLTLRYGPFRWPRTRIALDRIERAEVIDVVPGRHGGWGYRGSLRLFGRAAVVLRAGEALQLHLDGGQRFVVTIDGAETGAGTINDLVTRARTG